MTVEFAQADCHVWNPKAVGKSIHSSLIQINRLKGSGALVLRGSRQILLLQSEIPAMTSANYSAQEHLRDGRKVNIRALRADDEADMLAAIDRTDTESLKRRFFVAKRGFSEKEKAFFMNIDFVGHVALVAEIDEDGGTAIIGGSRYVMVGPGHAEVAFMVIDAYQGQGAGTILARHLIALARAAGLKQLSADILPENVAMRKVLVKFGFRTARSQEPQVVHMTLPLV